MFRSINTKENRLAARQMEINRHIEKNAATAGTHKTLTYVMWGDDARGVAYLKYWWGDAGKFTEYLSFSPRKDKEADVRLFEKLAELTKYADQREASKEAAKTKVTPERKDERGFVLADTRKTSALLKKYLREKFGVDFTVKTEKYSGGSSLNVSYVGGPAIEVVEAIVNRLEYGRFNSMEDICEHKNEAEIGLIIDGYRLETFKYNFVRRSIGLKLERAKAIEKMANLPFPKLEDENSLQTNFAERWGSAWNWSDFVYQAAHSHLNFVTDKMEQVEILEAYRTEGRGRDVYHFRYRFNGNDYTTETMNVQEPTVKATKHIEKNGVKMVDYSERAVAVIGNTYEIKDQLKAIGGTFNRFLKVEGEQVAGWIFSKSKESELADLLIEYAQA